MKELTRFREFLNEEKDPIEVLGSFILKIRKILNDPKAGTSPKMLNGVLGLMATVADFMDDEEYIMHLEQATESYQQDDMEGTKMHLLQALDSGEATYKDYIDQYLNKNIDEGDDPGHGLRTMASLANTRYILSYTTKDGEEKSRGFLSGLNAEDAFYELTDDDNVISAKIENIYYTPKGVKSEFTRDENGEAIVKIY